MKVLMFGWEFPPFNSGGLGTACLGLTQALAGTGAHVIFVLPKKLPVSGPTTTIFADERAPHITMRAVNAMLSPYLDLDQYGKIRIGQSDFYGASLIEEVRLYALRSAVIAKEEQFDVIHAHDWLSFGAGLEAKRISGKPLIVHVHATEIDRTGGHNPNRHIYELEKQGMELADLVVAVSHFTKAMIVKHYGIAPEKIVVVHNGVVESNSPQVLPDPLGLLGLKRGGRKIVLFAGRITLQKGPDYFLLSAKRVLDYYPNVLFVIAGSGDMQPAIIRMTANLGISDKVLFAGFLRGKELESVYQQADLFVMPSVSEPFGLIALEAIQNGTPVLISKQSGVSEVIKNALKVDFWDIDEMANKIVAVLYHESLRKTLAEQSFLEIPLVTWKKAADKCLEIYKKVISFLKDL